MRDTKRFFWHPWSFRQNPRLSVKEIAREWLVFDQWGANYRLKVALIFFFIFFKLFRAEEEIVENEKSYRPGKILVSGGTGFVG